MSKVKPFYSKKLFDDSFEHHKTFIRGRRTDHTAGHLLHIAKELSPTSLPPIDKSSLMASHSLLSNSRYMNSIGNTQSHIPSHHTHHKDITHNHLFLFISFFFLIYVCFVSCSLFSFLFVTLTPDRLKFKRTI